LHNKPNKSSHDTKHPHNYHKKTEENMPNNGKRVWGDLTTYQRWSLVITLLIAFITAVYAIFAAGQWIELKKSNKANEETLVTLQKATVIFDHMHVMGVGNYNKTGRGAIEITPYWSNVGNTQAKNLRTYLSPLNKKTNSTTEPDFNKIESSHLTVLAPKASTPGPLRILTMDDIDKMRAHKIYVTFWGEATYNDVFQGNKTHITQFCFLISGIGGPPNGRLDKGVVTLQFSACPTHNCMDEDCNRQQ
jgi:hypothetical protein